MNLGGIEVLIIFLVVVVNLGLVVWALVDIAGHTDAAWTAAGQSKVMWILVIVLTALFCGLGWLASIIYLVTTRPKLRSMESRGLA